MKRKEITLCLLGAAVVITVCASVFSGTAEVAASIGTGKAETVPTKYPAVSSAVAMSEKEQRVEYSIKDDELLTDTPGAQALSREAAAQAGAQMLWDYFGVDLKGATVYMGYSAGAETYPRAIWSGDVRFGSGRTPENPGFYFMVDALTGERLTASQGRILDKKVSLGYDSKLAENPAQYLSLAKDFAVEKKLVDGEVQIAIYNSQGYTNNDPNITVDVEGAGKKVSLSYSRYDQKLVGVSCSAFKAVTDSLLEKQAADMEAMIEAEQKKSSGGGSQLQQFGTGAY